MNTTLLVSLEIWQFLNYSEKHLFLSTNRQTSRLKHHLGFRCLKFAFMFGDRGRKGCPTTKNLRFATVLDVRRARSDERVARGHRKFAFRHSFGRPTSTK